MHVLYVLYVLQLLTHFRREMMVGNIENKDDTRDAADDSQMLLSK